MKVILKRISFLLLYFIMAFSFLLTYAADEQVIIGNILNSILNIVAWFAYAIALGSVIFLGIKYVLSGANERANLKGLLPKYLIGIALIVMCFGIAQAVSNIAGNDTAEEIIGVGANAK